MDSKAFLLAGELCFFFAYIASDDYICTKVVMQRSESHPSQGPLLLPHLRRSPILTLLSVPLIAAHIRTGGLNYNEDWVVQW
jgi:hypothetical protein